jgi:micrococcal nuclease
MELEKENTFDIKKIIIFIFATIIIFLSVFLYKSTLAKDEGIYKVVSVTDGDTITIERDNIRSVVRLLGIDTPELHKPNTPVQCYAKEAKLFLETLLLGKEVRLVKDIEDKDKYGRLLRYVFLNEMNVSTVIIGNGFSYIYDKPPNKLYYNEILTEMVHSMNQKKGLWKTCYDTDPRVKQHLLQYNFEYQSQQSSTTSNNEITPNEECKIKGNVNSSKEKIYHQFGSANYEKIQMNLTEGDTWFCTESEALAAGFRASKN